jgi:acetyl esterase/lipase
MIRSRSPIPALALAVTAVLLAACGSSGGERSTDSTPSTATDATATSSSVPASTPRSSTTATGAGARSQDCPGTGATAHRNLSYGSAELQALDVYTPDGTASCGPRPVVVWVHGGGYRTGDKAHKMPDKVQLFTDAGWVLVSVNYRLSPTEPSTDPARVKYPVHEQDVAAALGWIDQHIAEFGGDPQTMVLTGHSAGAFLVSLLSTDHHFVEDAGVDPDQIRCTVSLDTEYDIAEATRTTPPLRDIYETGFGPENYEAGSPANHVDDAAQIPPFLIVTRGQAPRVAQAKAFGAELEAAGVEVTVVDANPLTHAEVNDAVGQAGDSVVTPALMLFLKGCVSA